MKKSITIITLGIVLMFAVSVMAQTKVVVIPMGGKKPTGDAIAADVLEGKTFSNSDGIDQTGVMPNSTESITPSTSAQTITQGYHDGTGDVAGDTDLVNGNIRSGVNIFEVDGDVNVVDTSSGDAAESDILNGKKAWVDGSEVLGTIPNQSLDSASTTAPAGYYNTTEHTSVNPGLVANNLRKNIEIYGVTGTIFDSFWCSNLLDECMIFCLNHPMVKGASFGILDPLCDDICRNFANNCENTW